MTPEASSPIERVQLGVRMEKRMVKVLKGLAEYNSETLGQLLEKIVSHSFAPLAGEEGEWSASPHSKRELEVASDLMRIYELPFDEHAPRTWESPDESAPTES